MKENPKIADELESAIREKLGVGKVKKAEKKAAEVVEKAEKKRKTDAS